MIREYKVRAVEKLGHGDGKIVASYYDNTGNLRVGILFPNSQSLGQRKYPLATYNIKAIEKGDIISIESDVTNKELYVKLIEIAQSGSMPKYSEVISQEQSSNTAEFLKPSTPTISYPSKHFNHYRSHCFKCGSDIDGKTHKQCPSCKKYICLFCGACHCEYNTI